MGWWLLIAWLDWGVPSSTMLYTGLDEQACINLASEHLEAEQVNPGRMVEVVYINCLRGSAPRGR